MEAQNSLVLAVENGNSSSVGSNLLLVKPEQFLHAYNVDVSAFVEKKNNLDYLSWAYAIRFLREYFPTFTVDFEKNAEGMPYFSMPNEGGSYVMPYITDGVKKSSSLFFPVMDFRNKSIINPTSMDLNKALMRGAVKVIALVTGLGLKLYTGEDLDNSQKEKYIEKIEKLLEQKQKLLGDDALVTSELVSLTWTEKQLVEYGRKLKEEVEKLESFQLEKNNESKELKEKKELESRILKGFSKYKELTGTDHESSAKDFSDYTINGLTAFIEELRQDVKAVKVVEQTEVPE